jgi:hypothetical protein
MRPDQGQDLPGEELRAILKSKTHANYVFLSLFNDSERLDLLVARSERRLNRGHCQVRGTRAANRAKDRFLPRSHTSKEPPDV